FLPVQIDSLSAVQLLTDTDKLEHQHANTVNSYKMLLQRDLRLKVTHIFREGNYLADSLASRGLTMDFGTQNIDTSDSMVQYWAHFDRVGGATPRQIVI
ncbi:hypothetical protein LINPERHAP1_LOCUS8090, partial [Linum perenne]